MKVLMVSTTGVRKDGITAWMLHTFGATQMPGLSGIDTVGYTGVEPSLVEELAASGFQTHILPNRKAHPIAYMRALRRLMRTKAYDIIHVNGNSGTAAIELLCSLGVGVRARVVHSHNTQGMYPAYDRILRPAMNRLCTDRIACGHEAGKWLFADDEFTIVRNCRNFAQYAFSLEARKRARQELGLVDDDVAIGHVGYFHEPKNHSFLLAAFAFASEQNDRLRLFLIGEGELRDEIEADVHQRGLDGKVTFLGRSSRVSEYLSAFDLAVLPSLYEGLPTVAIEWQISGLPALISANVTKECGVTELVEFLPITDVAMWASRMARAEHTDRRAASREAQRALRAAGYDVAESAARLGSLYAAIGERAGLM